MVQVQVTATVKVAGGPTVPATVSLSPDTYAFGSVHLDAAGGAAEAADVALLPDGGDVSLLAINVRPTSGDARSVTVVPKHDGDTGDALTVDGSLLVANAGVLAALVTGSPRTLTITNLAAVEVDVDVLAARAD